MKLTNEQLNYIQQFVQERRVHFDNVGNPERELVIDAKGIAREIFIERAGGTEAYAILQSNYIKLEGQMKTLDCLVTSLRHSGVENVSSNSAAQKLGGEIVKTVDAINRTEVKIVTGKPMPSPRAIKLVLVNAAIAVQNSLAAMREAQDAIYSRDGSDYFHVLNKAIEPDDARSPEITMCLGMFVNHWGCILREFEQIKFFHHSPHSSRDQGFINGHGFEASMSSTVTKLQQRIDELNKAAGSDPTA